MPLLSVVLPCRNCQTTLAACLDSLLAQTVADFEILAVDDASTDGTADILRQYALRDSRIQCFFLPRNQGVALAMDYGMERAGGQFIARMDADDIAHCNRFEKQLQFLWDNPEIGLCATQVVFGGNRKTARGYALFVDWTNSLLTHEDFWKYRYVEQPYANPGIVFKKELIERFGGFRRGDFPEDYEFFLRLLHGGVKMGKVACPLLTWNDPPSRLSRTDRRYSRQAFFRVKAAFFARWFAEQGKGRDIELIGSGRETRKRAAFLEENGLRITGYYDVDPKKIGHRILGRPVRDYALLPQRTENSVFLVSYIGKRGAREQIERELRQKKYEYERDWILLA